ncbi:MAG: NUDIX hydrolase [Gammaproteobacteria bacterium]
MTRTSRVVFQGRMLRVEVRPVALAGGGSLDLEIVHHPGGAAAVAVDGRGRVCMLRQFRHVFGAWLWELPAGRIDPGEAPLATAQRELAEEAGVSAGRWQSLGALVPTPGYCDERVHLFLARDLGTVPPRTEAGEILQVHWLDLDDAVQRATEGDIDDAKTALALLRARAAIAAGR